MNVTDKSKTRVYHFDIAGLFAATTVVAIAIAVACNLRSWYPLNVFFAGLMASVFALQIVVFRGKIPRLASLLAGFIYTFVIAVYLTFAFNLKFGSRYDWSSFSSDAVSTLYISIIGSVFGFLFGMVIAGIFAITRKLKAVDNGSEPGTPVERDSV